MTPARAVMRGIGLLVFRAPNLAEVVFAVTVAMASALTVAGIAL